MYFFKLKQVFHFLTVLCVCYCPVFCEEIKPRLARQAQHLNAAQDPNQQQLHNIPAANQQQQIPVQANQQQVPVQQHQQGFQQPQQQNQQYHQAPQAQVHSGQHGGARAGAPGSHLANYPDCTGDIARYCSKIQPENDIAMLECLQDLAEDQVEVLSGECEHLVWQFKVNITQDARFHQAAQQFCANELPRFPDCTQAPQEQGHLLSCLLEKKENLTHGQCKNFLTRIQRIAFSDFRLVSRFVKACSNDVNRFQCGSLQTSRDHNPNDKVHHSQGSTLQCLIEKMVSIERTPKGQAKDSLETTCRHEVLRLAELQSDDYHLDRPLFFACRIDREKFCRNVQAGEGRVFQCLFSQKNQPGFSPECAEHLVIRAQLIAQDYKASHLMVQSCRRDIEKYQCQPHKDHDAPEHFLLSFVLLCLENVAHSSQPLDPQCQQQLVRHRQLMMSDYRIGPEVVLSCQEDISQHCGDQLEGNGKTLHCLMGVESKKTKESDGLKSECKQALKALLKIADPGENYQVDVALYKSCQSLIEGKCQHESGSESDMLSCLMNHIETQDMTQDCEDRLLEIQYFLSRDFTLDTRLYMACHQDAMKFCGAPKNWHMEPTAQNQPDPGPSIFSCLYRNVYASAWEEEGADKIEPVSPQCRSQVIRTMRERAVSVRLMPEIEEACRLALAAKCSHDTKPGEELKCLQEHMEDDEFKETYKQCSEKIEKFTEAEVDDVRLNRALSRVCRPVIEGYCKDLIDEEIDHGDVMECLQKHRNAPEMNSKCRSYVNFYAMVSLKDYHFSMKFKRMCAQDIKEHCSDISTNDKTEIIRCLGEVMVNYQVLGEGQGLTKDCKRQLRNDFLSMENADKPEPVRGVDMDSGFWKICKSDIKKSGCFPMKERKSAHEVMECLRKHHVEQQQQLEPACQKLLFGLERMERVDNRMDAQLAESCSQEIQIFCHDSTNILKCLKMNVRQPKMGAECLEVIRTREYEQAQDIRLRPGLLKACRKDLEDLCHDVYQTIRNQMRQHGAQEKELEGAAVHCLRVKMTSVREHTKLHPGCMAELTQVIMETEVDPRLDPVFYKKCEANIKTYCTRELLVSGGHGTIMECMKTTYHSNHKMDESCRKELARRTSEALSDIHLDPVLHESCALDIQHYCRDTPPGEGRIVICLLQAAKSTNTLMTPGCKAKLKDREQLWQIAKRDEPNIFIPETVGEIGQLVMESSARNSLVTIFLVIVVIIFAGGLCFGRVTKRVRAEVKNK